jgi:hypothetical protein
MYVCRDNLHYIIYQSILIYLELVLNDIIVRTWKDGNNKNQKRKRISNYQKTNNKDEQIFDVGDNDSKRYRRYYRY